MKSLLLTDKVLRTKTDLYLRTNGVQGPTSFPDGRPRRYPRISNFPKRNTVTGIVGPGVSVGGLSPSKMALMIYTLDSG
ncbi:hypothetical protein Trydic_g21034 [Trypoxylus dichotomus]